jgi:hypothetical protein
MMDTFPLWRPKLYSVTYYMLLDTFYPKKVSMGCQNYTHYEPTSVDSVFVVLQYLSLLGKLRQGIAAVDA